MSGSGKTGQMVKNNLVIHLSINNLRPVLATTELECKT
jgi:hypothetical protein